MNHLKIVENGWANYTGEFGMVHFENGVSVEPIPDQVAGRLAGLVRCVSCDAEGNELGANPSVAGKLASDRKTGAQVIAESDRQTEEARKAELAAQKEKAEKEKAKKQAEAAATEAAKKAKQDQSGPSDIDFEGDDDDIDPEEALAKMREILEPLDEEKLKEIAAEGGIKGLREYTDVIGVKDNKIQGLITETLKLRAKVLAEAPKDE